MTAPPTAADIVAVQRLLRDKVGALRILFKEEGAKENSPRIDIVHREIAERWSMPPNEQAALLHLLRRARPPGGREVADFSAFCRQLRASSAAATAPAAANHSGGDALQTSPRSPRHTIASISTRRNEANDLRALLQQQANSSGSVSFGGFMNAVAAVDISVTPHEARKYFAAALAQDHAERAASVETLVRVALPHLSLCRQRVLSSELVRDVLAWDRRADERVTLPVVGLAAAELRIASANRMTRSQQLKISTSQQTLAALRENDQWHISPKQHRAPSPREIPKPRLTPRRDRDSAPLEDKPVAGAAAAAIIPKPPPRPQQL